jgi:uncharacterized surface protein with fasciclin (FAS1) repeats
MKTKINNFLKLTTVVAIAAIGVVGCNKEFNSVAPLPTPPAFNVVNSIDSLVKVNPNFTILKAAIQRAGFNALLADPNRQFTVFAPTDLAFAQIGITSPAATAALPVATLQSILSYHVIPQVFTSAQIPTAAPNVKLPSLLQLGNISPLVKVNLYPSKRGSNVFVNDVAVATPDVAASNGVVHVIGKVLLPPSTTLKGVIAANSDLSMLQAAIIRADSGIVNSSPTRLDSLANFALTNLTIMAPTNTAFAQLIYGIVYPNILTQVSNAIATANPSFTPAQVTAAATPIAQAQATAASTNPATFNLLPVQTVRGIVAYHIFGGAPFNPGTGARYFGTNFTGVTSVPTALGGSPFPPVGVDNTGAMGPRFLGAGNGAGNFSNLVTTDLQALNGVLHKIDRVLLPQ